MSFTGHRGVATVASVRVLRASIKADLRTAKILQRLDIEDVSDEQIDAPLDEE